jgi:hypothetical protein
LSIIVVVNEIKICRINLAFAASCRTFRQWTYARAEGGDEGADEELQHVDVAQDLDASPEGPKASLASEGKPQIINPVS